MPGGPFGAHGLCRFKRRGNVCYITVTSSPGIIGLGEAVVAWLAAESVCQAKDLPIIKL